MMDGWKLEAFVTVAEEESFSAAADRLRVAQSTVSSRVKELEAHLGQRLFARSSRQVRLSPAGEAALPAARSALTALASVRQVVDDVVGIRSGRVRLGLVTGADLPSLGATLAAFATEFPEIELVIDSGASIDLEHAVSDGRLDIALVVHVDPTRLRWQELIRDPLTVVGLPTTSATTPIAELDSHPLIVLDAGAGARSALDSIARRAGSHLNVAAQVSTPMVAWELFEHGMGLLVVPGSLARETSSVLVDADGTETIVQVGLISHPDIRTPATELLLTRLTTGLTPPAT